MVVSGVARYQGVEGYGMAGSGDTFEVHGQPLPYTHVDLLHLHAEKTSFCFVSKK
jgi:hypothetical protein